ncbi:MAG: 2-hydroxychromene-2-carboxylate isomerase [Myxococcota bacterium]
MSRRVEIFFDYSSPFAYLGTTQIERVAGNAEVVWKPFLLGALFKAIGTPIIPLATFADAKRAHQQRDLDRWAEHWNVPFKFRSQFPLNSVGLLRLTLAAPKEQRPALIHRLMRLCWVEDRMPDESALRECLSEVGLDPNLVTATKDPAIKQALFDATQEAIDRHVPGAPTFFVGDELFWGQDRLHFVEKALR